MANSIIPHHIFVSNIESREELKLPLSLLPLLDVEYRDQSLRDAASGLRLRSMQIPSPTLLQAVVASVQSL